MNQANETRTFTHGSNRGAEIAALMNKGTSYSYDAGNENTGSAHFCKARGRVIHRCITPEGKVIL